MADDVKACPFCGDPMRPGFGGFLHTKEAAEGSSCFLRHNFYGPEQLDWWNTRTDDALIRQLREAAIEEAARVAEADYTPGYGSPDRRLEWVAEAQRRDIAGRIRALLASQPDTREKVQP